MAAKKPKAKPELQPTGAFTHYSKFALKNLLPNPQNPRKHAQSEIDQLVKNIQHFGFTNPILFQKKSGIIIAGHGRHVAAVALKLEHVPAIAWDVSDGDAMAHMIADNRLGEMSVWDIPALKDGLAQLDGHGYDVSLSGFDNINIDVLLSRSQEVSFLAGVDPSEEGEEDDSGQTQGDAAGEDVKKLTFALTSEDRATVLQGLQSYTDTHNLNHTADALVHMIKAVCHA